MWASKRLNKGGNKASPPTRMFHNACTWWAQYRCVHKWFQATKQHFVSYCRALIAPPALTCTQCKLYWKLMGREHPLPKKRHQSQSAPAPLPHKHQSQQRKEHNSNTTLTWQLVCNSNIPKQIHSNSPPSPNCSGKTGIANFFLNVDNLKPWIHQLQGKKSNWSILRRLATIRKRWGCGECVDKKLN